ncbi:MAG: glutamate synthase [Candidatus Sumerlaeia bacterium]|nr:glutamate synthase [Candidatus Sumerlaeia bacterium]
MAELVPAPFRDLALRMALEPGRQDSLFDLARRSWYVPADSARDLTVRFHGHRAGNPAGPASGPHTQMAQNLMLCYVAGARIIELKTVQVNDRLDIPRPCIDMTNVGYNVEWSQELRVEESLREYVAGMMLIHQWRFAHPEGNTAWQGPAGDPVYDISLGYDLAGIRSDKVQRYLDGIRDASRIIESLRAQLPAGMAAARALEYPARISDTLTLSTFHGCPTDEIERICEFLLAERDLDVIVKMNPPTLGRERLEHLLHDVLGYDEIRVKESAYTASQTFDEAVEMVRRLSAFAAARGRSLGCKFSNTLEVVNHRDFFPAGNEVMYLSGPPLHVITMTLTDEFRRVLGPGLPVSFSAGIVAENFADAVACGFVPVTTCTDLLKTGGYGRLPAYLENLALAMDACGATTIDEFVLRHFGNEAEARRRAEGSGIDAAAWAGVLNTTTAAEKARRDPRYHADKNRRVPKRIDSRLVLFDCLTCDKCVPVCPNDANFVYPLAERSCTHRDLVVQPSGAYRVADEEKSFRVAKKHQIGNYAEFCNECGNCDTFCPEYGGPYIEKPSFYRTEASWHEAAPRDGFVVTRTETGARILGRVRGGEVALERRDNALVYRNGAVEVLVDEATGAPREVRLLEPLDGERTIDMGLLHALAGLLDGVLDASRVNQINVAWMTA